MNRLLNKLKPWQLLIIAIAGLLAFMLFWEFWFILKYIMLATVIVISYKLLVRIIKG